MFPGTADMRAELRAAGYLRTTRRERMVELTQQNKARIAELQVYAASPEYMDLALPQPETPDDRPYNDMPIELQAETKHQASFLHYEVRAHHIVCSRAPYKKANFGPNPYGALLEFSRLECMAVLDASGPWWVVRSTTHKFGLVPSSFFREYRHDFLAKLKTKFARKRLVFPAKAPKRLAVAPIQRAPSRKINAAAVADFLKTNEPASNGYQKVAEDEDGGS